MTTPQPRDVAATEWMDDPDCDRQRLTRTYRQFGPVNRLVSGWRRLYERELRPRVDGQAAATLLDVGFGGGDVVRALARWAAADGLNLQITAIDPDPRANEFVATLPPTPRVRYVQASSADLVSGGARYDLVISNHLLHHLDPGALTGLLRNSERLARRLAMHNDLRRARVPYLAYGLATWPLARHSFLHDDGLISIRRSYRPAELAALVPAGWQVEPRSPYRLLVRYEPPEWRGM